VGTGFSTDKAGIDVQDANSILEALGYATPAVPTARSLATTFAGRLRAFQQINEIPVSGKLDNATLNRLFHLDFDAKNLKRAKRFKADARADPIESHRERPDRHHPRGGPRRIAQPAPRRAGGGDSSVFPTPGPTTATT
jgi:hypothetical protein